MSSKTTNFNLHKIDLTDAPPDITVLNQNWDAIDEQLKTLETADAKALPAAGGTMAGTIEFKKVENGYGRLAKNHGSTADYGMYLTDANANGESVKLVLSATDNSLKLTTKDNVVNKIYGEHNKGDVRDAVITASTSDITAGTTGLTTGKLYVVYE